MKALACLGLVMLASGWARGDADRSVNSGPVSRVDVLVQVELVELAHVKITEFLGNPVLAGDAKALRVKAQDLVRGKEAKVLHTLMVRTAAGGGAECKSVREFIYPTEYEPPELPNGIGNVPANPGGEPEFRNPEQPDVPTAFETRNAGEGLEVEVTADRARGTVGVKLWLDLTRFPRVVEWARRKTPAGNEFALGMPEFEALREVPKLDVPDGGYAFGGILRRESEPGQRIMVFVRCDVLDPGEGN